MHANLLEVFGERDAAKRRDAIRRTYTEDVVAADPDGQVTGYEELDAKVQEILDGAPGFVFHAEGSVYTAGELHYLGWALGPEGADPVARGADAVFVRDGRISRVYTFLFS
ncbi:nuclear transport factor 2 family protein [Leifsonia flava]|uniref:Nuclear transport factor 2 family protein n=2 Tax=Orlajensenia leifsoniae TaxID=2561933 RepID=A0A4Y9R3S9_9MICO|nr:nuclear transport factor 2 family protein [Leifsonia flava]